LFAWDFSSGPTGPIEWGQYRGGADRRAYYELGKNLPNQAYLAAHAHGSGTISGSGINCGSDCIERYAKGTNVSLTATPTAQASFSGWQGACAGQGNPCIVRVDRYTSATAIFSTPLTVQFSGTGSGSVTSSPAGINCPAACNGMLAGGSVVRLVASAAAGSGFDGWSGACAGVQSDCLVIMDQAANVGAAFTNSRTVSVSKAGLGSGAVTSEPGGLNCGATCTALFPPGSTVALIAQPANDSYLVNWSGACAAFLDQRCTLALDANKSATATFGRRPVLSVALNGSGTGRVTSSPAGIDCGAQCTTTAVRPGSTILLTAQPDPDSEFVTWAGGCTNNAINCFPQMDQDRAVTANFLLRPFLFVQLAGEAGVGKVTSSAGGIDCGNGPCNARFDANAVVILTASVLGTGSFRGWSGACSGSSATCTVTMAARRSVTATFATTAAPPPDTGNPGGGSASGVGGSGGGGGGRPDILTLLGLFALVLVRVRINPAPAQLLSLNSTTIH
jgi:hypothetical protein